MLRLDAGADAGPLVRAAERRKIPLTVVSVDRAGRTEFAQAYGLADRAHQVPNTLGTQFGIASGTKGLTALTVASLISDDVLALGTTARSVLGTDLPLIGNDVTVEHLLAHRSGIGDYFDEEAEGDLLKFETLEVRDKTNDRLAEAVARA